MYSYAPDIDYEGYMAWQHFYQYPKAFTFGVIDQF